MNNIQFETKKLKNYRRKRFLFLLMADENTKKD